MVQVQLRVPDGLPPGTQFQARGPDGQMFTMTVPMALGPDRMILANLPPALAPQTATPQYGGFGGGGFGGGGFGGGGFGGGMVPPHPPAAPQTQTVRIVIPPGVVPGQQMRVNTPGGPVLITVPPGSMPGQQLQMQVPVSQPQPQPQRQPEPPAPPADPYQAIREQDELVRQEQERREREMRERDAEERQRQQVEQARMREQQQRERERLARRAEQQRLAAEREAQRLAALREQQKKREEQRRREEERRREEAEREQQRKREEQLRRKEQKRKAREAEEKRLAEEERRREAQELKAQQLAQRRATSLHSPNQRELEAVFTKAIALGLTDEASVATMRRRIESGDFTTQHYLSMFSARISKHEAAGMPAFNPASPWIKQTNGSRSYYYRDHKTHPPAYSLIQPDEGVKKIEPHRRNGMHETADVEFEKHFAMAQSYDVLRAKQKAHPEPEPEPEPEHSYDYAAPEPEPEHSYDYAATRIQACYRGHQTRSELLPTKRLIGRWSSVPVREKFSVEDHKWVPVERDVKGTDGKPLPAGWVQDPPGTTRFVNLLTQKSHFSRTAPASPVPGVAAQLIIYFESHGVARLLRMKANGQPMVDTKKAQAKCDMTIAEHGIQATKGDIIVVTKSTGAPPLPPGWATGHLDNGTVFYYDTSDTSNLQLERPCGGQKPVVADVWEGYVEAASVSDAVTGKFPRACVEVLPSAHRLSGEVCLYSVDWHGAGPETHKFRLVEAKGHVIKGLLRLPSKADVSSGTNLHMIHNDPTLPGYSKKIGSARAFRSAWGSLALTRKSIRGSSGNWQRFLPAMSAMSLLVGGDEHLWSLVGKYLSFRWAVENPTPESEAFERVSKGDLVMGILNRIAGNDLEGTPLPPSAADRAKAEEATRVLSSITPQEFQAALTASNEGADAGRDKASYTGLIKALQGKSKRQQVDAIRRQAALVALGVAARNAKECAKQDVQLAIKDLEEDAAAGAAIAAHKQKFAQDIAALLRQRPSKAAFQRQMAEKQLEMELRIKAELSACTNAGAGVAVGAG